MIANAVDDALGSSSRAALAGNQPLSLVRGLHHVLAALKADEGAIAVSRRHAHARARVGELLRRFSGITLIAPEEVYPARLSESSDTAVVDARWLAAWERAQEGEPFTEWEVTVSGAVASPRVLLAAHGTPVFALVNAAGGSTAEDVVVLAGDPMHGRVVHGTDGLTKDVTQLFVLERDHPLVRHLGRGGSARWLSACDGCGACTWMCPAGLDVLELVRAAQLGRELEAHGCVECRVCELVACPARLPIVESLTGTSPSAFTFTQSRVARSALAQRAGLSRYDEPSPEFRTRLESRSLWLPMEGAVPGVQARQRVAQRARVATASGEAAAVFAPRASVVASVDPAVVSLVGV